MVEQIQDLKESLENYLKTFGLEFIDDYDDIIMSENRLVMTTHGGHGGHGVTIMMRIRSNRN